ncbi:Tetratricopeptide repeat protein 27 [Anthophora quadrimaculata]
MNILNTKKIINEEIEIALLVNFVENEGHELPFCVQNILNGQYEDVINDKLPSSVIQTLHDNNEFTKLINSSIEKGNVESWLCKGIASLLYFIQCNWTGPQIDINIEWLKVKNEEAVINLSLHDECNINVKMPELLYLSKIIFSNEILQNTYESSIWWLFRVNLLHQLILNESSGIIFDETEQLIKRIYNLQLLKENFYCATLFYIEAAQFYFYYRRIQNSENYVELAQGTAKLNLNLEGALGKRTKFQHEDKAQLFLKIGIEKNQFPSRSCANLPKSLKLNDDIRLDCIKFTESMQSTPLGAVEEAIILAKHIQLQLSQPRDKLTDEEVKPYLDVVTESTNNWSIKTASLYYRCALESGDKRTVERSMMQIEHLIHELNSKEVSVIHRMDLFFASGLKPIWALEQMWAQLMLSLGLVKSALDVFLKLQLWEEVINCYNILELKHKAAEIIHQEISKKPTVRLWCLLGDATQDPSHYEIAWKLSNEKSSRVQRHWGFFYFAKKNYEEAVKHLKLSAQLNNIQESVWIRLGYAALQIEDWKLAATAYKRYCALEHSTFEAWNNLATAYVKLGDKEKAWKSLQDAIKCNYDRWQIWDNLMIVSIDLGHFSEVIRCYHRILDLKNHHIDIEILNILTNAVLNNINDSDGNPAQKLLPKVLELFGRISSITSNNSDIWRMYGELTALKNTDIDNDKVVRYLQQAHRIAVSDPKWLQQEESVKKMAFAGKVVLITGASSGIGAATAIHFSQLGASLSLTGRNVQKLNEVAEKCTSNKPLIITGELTNELNVKNIIESTIKHYGKLDILVNNAGVLENGSIENTSLEQYDRVFNINVRSVYHLTMLAVPHIIKTKGNIVNVSSVVGLRSFPGVLSYCMSKSAIDQFTRCIALELAPKQVRVNAVNPGVVITNLHKSSGMTDEQLKAFFEHSKETHALGRPGDASEVAKTIAFLASDNASFITGETLSVDGGRHIMCPR